MLQDERNTPTAIELLKDQGEEQVLELLPVYSLDELKEQHSLFAQLDTQSSSKY